MLSAFAKINTLPDRSNVTISKPKKGSWQSNQIIIIFT
jgi:hypothetical protein